MGRPKGAKDVNVRVNAWRHGTVYGYRGRGCRCDECRKAWTDYRRPMVAAYRARKKAEAAGT